MFVIHAIRRASLRRASSVFLLVVTACFCLICGSHAAAQAQPAPGAVRTLRGTVKTATPVSLTFTADAGDDLTVGLAANTRIQRVAPGEKDLSSALTIAPSDLLPGDRVLVSAKPGEDGKTLVALRIVVMKKEEITSIHQKELQDWQRRGVGGMVKTVDVPGSVVIISTLGAAGTKELKVVVSKQTVLRRYAANSVKFDDAQKALLEDVKPGDQLRARGARSADGGEFAAEEIVSGTFRNLAGLLTAIDLSANTLTVQDLATKKPVMVLITAQSQLKKLPAMLSAMIAARLRGVGPDGQPVPANGGKPPEGARPGGMGGNGGQRGGDFQQMMSHLPAASLSDLQKGDAVMIVATPGSETVKPTVITLLGGVEPILTAGGSDSLLSPWTLSSPPEGVAAQ